MRPEEIDLLTFGAAYMKTERDGSLSHVPIHDIYKDAHDGVQRVVIRKSRGERTRELARRRWLEAVYAQLGC